MQDFTYHIHTARCDHAIGQDEDYVLAAIEAGYKILGFSDHAPFNNLPNKRHRMKSEQFNEYLSSIENLKEKYKDKIAIYKGIEAEYYAGCEKEVADFFDKLDYVILSLHSGNPNRPFMFAHENSEEELYEYGKLAQRAIPAHKWLYLAHPDYYMRHQKTFSPACEYLAHTLAKLCEEYNLPMEINITGCYGEKTDYPQGQFYFYPFKPFWAIVSQYKVKCIIGLDAHDPAQILDKNALNKAIEELADLNLDYITEPILG